MSPRRLFPFSGPKSSVPSRPPGPPPPSDKDFSIESILQAIEPDIQGTLDSIAEICGRSKLSLANEYGSHIAPLGEIRAPASGLVPVEEASSTDERRADESLIIFDDNPGLVEPDRDMHPSTFYRYLENLRQAASLLERNGTTVSGPSAQLNASTSAAVASYVNSPELDVAPLPTSREFVSRPKNTGRDLLAMNITSSQDDHFSPNIVTPAVVSEFHLDAQAGERNTETDPSVLSVDQLNLDDRIPESIRSLLGWLRWSARIVGPESRPALQSAEGRLRAMLEQSAEDRFSSQAV
ncbi:Methylenetetrahydrofolate reductase 2 [Penicillium atrosanguineum]|uniref:Methylenetetrahydrofolate reductase 2 n=1 Tax=Penicillium atrosanguineum TaxID=1132637 RepID=UPI0023999F31|nr:Methylenetetrahydrofolate reductase 2 [Penicillium atrosanguineum]KAJ5304252.1 Methylenetetrahydrofolate reductase 2 [Penicillium atrosanguineum]